jgi:hypothetical protein
MRLNALIFSTSRQSRDPFAFSRLAENDFARMLRQYFVPLPTASRGKVA